MSVEQSSSGEIPRPEELAFLHPLYSEIATSDVEYLSCLRGFEAFKFDMFCTGCEREATFQSIRRVSIPSGSVRADMARAAGEWEFAASCTREGHKYHAHFVRRGNGLMKVGQYPSVADIEGADLRKYRKLLRDGYFEELNRAVRLISHGVGIGAFVYLRRIFEKLIWDHHAERVVASGPVEGFDRMRMDEKIQALADVLPRALVINKAAYAILSKGIHELTEDECKLYFPVVKAAIINILEEDFQARERESASKRIADEIAKISTALGAKASGGEGPAPTLADLAKGAQSGG